MQVGPIVSTRQLKALNCTVHGQKTEYHWYIGSLIRSRGALLDDPRLFRSRAVPGSMFSGISQFWLDQDAPHFNPFEEPRRGLQHHCRLLPP